MPDPSPSDDLTDHAGPTRTTHDTHPTHDAGRARRVRRARHARQEADDVLGADWSALVLEPSPPAVTSGPWFADDPVAPPAGTTPTVAPTGIDGATTWDAWLSEHPERTEWVAQRWLGGPRQLPPEPSGLAATRESLHRLAAYVIGPARHRVTGKFGLRWTLGGFGTPFFGDDRQIRVVGDTLVDQRGAEVRTAALTTLADAADFLASPIDADTAAEHDTPAVGDPGQVLTVEPAAANFLGAWFGMAFAGLEALRAHATTVDPTRPQLWPGHFDAALEAGDEDHRASYGASPGDATIPEPYLYVSIWWPDRITFDQSEPAWNAPGFTGRVLRRSELSEGDPVTSAVGFWTETSRLVGQLRRSSR